MQAEDARQSRAREQAVLFIFNATAPTIAARMPFSGRAELEQSSNFLTSPKGTMGLWLPAARAS